MIIGNGLIANLFRDSDKPDTIIFASGVSDPSCVDPIQFIREEELLFSTIQKNQDKTIVYFGTTTPKDSLYAKHKRRMEELVQKSHGYWVIFRIGPIATKNGTGNTFHDFALRRVLDGQQFTLFANESRPILTPEQLKFMVNHWLVGPCMNTCISIDGPSLNVLDIVHSLEKRFNKKANYILG